jgi:4-hydroxybutyrate CoA-transferase
MTKHIQAEYSRKLTSPRQAVLHIKPGDRVFSALGAAEPPALIQAMADQAESLANVSLVQMLQFRKYDYIKPENRNNVRLDSWFSSAQARQAINEGWGDFTPQHFHDVPYFCVMI